MKVKIFLIQWRHPNFGWNTVYVLASDKCEAVTIARSTPPKGMAKEFWNCITSYQPHKIKSKDIFYCCPDPE